MLANKRIKCLAIPVRDKHMNDRNGEDEIKLPVKLFRQAVENLKVVCIFREHFAAVSHCFCRDIRRRQVKIRFQQWERITSFAASDFQYLMAFRDRKHP